ncbi:MAG: mechanosensitive ion channel protein MscS [Bacteroidetes bacterium]|nr:mechanosensitive ion channel protein MscS [Bacteroidota bacterium]
MLHKTIIDHMFRQNWMKFEGFIEPVIIIIISYAIAKLLSLIIRRYIRKSAHIMHFDPTNYSFLQNAVSFLVFIAATIFIFYRVPALHSLSKTMFAGAGIAAAVIGFASQEAFSNIISGVFIVIFKPFSVGDYIKLLTSNQLGVVEDITIRHTVIKSIENRRIVIPNSVISREAILNSTIKDPRVMFNLEVLLVYETDIEKALNIMKEEAQNHPDFLDGRTEARIREGIPPIVAKVVALEDTGVRCRAYVWAKNNDTAFEMKCDLLKMLKERFDRENIQISHAQRLMGMSSSKKQA